MPSNPVLVVDDDPTLRALTSDILTSVGYPVRTAANGAEALTQLEQERPAVVLLDMRMPVCDGWDFAAAVKQRNLQVPIVVMTAAVDAMAWAEEIGADGCLPKPFDIDELLAAVGQFQSTPVVH